MASLGDVFQLIDEQEQYGQQVLNVYFYRLDTPVVGNAAEMLVSSFITEVLPDIRAIQTDVITHRSVSAKNLYDETEAHTELISLAGTQTGEGLPGFSAYAYRLIGDNAAVRDGQKRYAGASEQHQVGGVITSAPMLALMVALATQLATGLSIGVDTNALMPVIVGRILDGGQYRLPANSGETVLSNVIDSLFNADISSQTSRKVGRGA